MKVPFGFIGKLKAEKKVKSILKNKSYSCGSNKEISFGLQFPISMKNNKIGLIRIYEKNNKETNVDLSAITDSQEKKRIFELLSEGSPVATSGKIKLPKRFFFSRSYKDEILRELKIMLIQKFRGYEKTTKNHKIEFLIKLNGITAIAYSNGTIMIQGKETTLSDEIINEINRIYELNSKRELQNLLKINLPLISESEYEKINEELKNFDISVENYIKPDVYSYLNPNDRIEIRDGLLLFQFVKDKKLPLKNFASLVRNFAVAYEGFLMKFLFDIGVIKEDKIASLDYINIGTYIKPGERGKNVLELKYPTLLMKKPALANKIWVYWQECRNDYLHSDPLKFPLLSKIEDAESKIREIIIIMEDCLDIFAGILNPTNEISDLNKSSVIGIDEAGKGDYFGPLVIGAVFVDSESINMLSSLGIRDSKLLSDSKIKQLFQEIEKRCKIVHVKINPRKYNELYSEIKNLNHILAWGHARALENILSNVKCEYAISDQFGNENLIKSRLMQLGRKIKLIQQPKAENNIAVAAASIVARYFFLQESEKIGRRYKIKFPKGASQEVEKVAKDFVSKYGKEELKEVAKIHFKTTDKIKNLDVIK